MAERPENSILLDVNDKHPELIDFHISAKCPHCGRNSHVSLVAVPRFELISRYTPEKVGIAYKCDACNFPIFFRFHVLEDARARGRIYISKEYEEIERPMETFEYQYLPTPVAADLHEALTCYSHSCFNAFAAMCRRCLQSASEALGVKGQEKVSAQIKNLRDELDIDEDTYESMRQVMFVGHDGAHPNLPGLTADRAGLALELIKDVMYQLFVRKQKAQEAMAARQKAIADKKAGESE